MFAFVIHGFLKTVFFFNITISTSLFIMKFEFKMYFFTLNCTLILDREIYTDTQFSSK